VPRAAEVKPRTPGLERLVFEEERARARDHQSLAGGHEPLPRFERFAGQRAGCDKETEIAGGGFEIPERDELEQGRHVMSKF
jgi:hypothetical protein